MRQLHRQISEGGTQSWYISGVAHVFFLAEHTRVAVWMFPEITGQRRELKTGKLETLSALSSSGFELGAPPISDEKLVDLVGGMTYSGQT